MFFDTRKSACNFQRLHHDWHHRFSSDSLKYRPSVLNQLGERVFSLRDGERRQRDRKPTIRRTQQDGTRLFIALLVEMIEVRMPASTIGQVFLPGLAECVRHTARCAAGITFYP